MAAIDLIYIRRNIFSADIRHIVDYIGIQHSISLIIIRSFGKCKSLIHHIILVYSNRKAAELIVEIRHRIGYGNDRDEEYNKQTQYSHYNSVPFDLFRRSPQDENVPELGLRIPQISRKFLRLILSGSILSSGLFGSAVLFLFTDQSAFSVLYKSSSSVSRHFAGGRTSPPYTSRRASRHSMYIRARGAFPPDGC